MAPKSFLPFTFTLKPNIMRSKKIGLSTIPLFAVILCLSCLSAGVNAQDDSSITVYQFRHIPDNKIDEFLKRETTYWSKVAERALKNKTMTFWGVFEKVGGYDLPNSPNFLFINTFPNIDKAGEVFGAAEKVTGLPMAKIETNSLGTTTSQLFVHNRGWAEVAGVNPPKDFNYIVMIYHNSNYPDSLVALENKHWSPFIKKAMDDKNTPQMGWGNAIVLAPSGENIKFNTISYDLYKTLKDALMPAWNPATVFPNDGLTNINALEINRRNSEIYHVVKVVAAN
jgi:hypothetical protein